MTHPAWKENSYLLEQQSQMENHQEEISDTLKKQLQECLSDQKDVYGLGNMFKQKFEVSVRLMQNYGVHAELLTF